jgi:hypothetical protein
MGVAEIDRIADRMGRAIILFIRVNFSIPKVPKSMVLKGSGYISRGILPPKVVNDERNFLCILLNM